ncbi:MULTISPECIES: RICIN domain-containing protein [Streptomyces]|uniref:RICIN domain-containing protein n=2 Tax=Streptomyces TaxID=1883 RepID=A0ABV9IPD4_9ACTN
MTRYLRAATALGAISLFGLGVTAAPASAAGFGPIKHSATGKCIDVKGGSTQVHALILQWGCHGGSNQAWLKVPVSGGFQLLNQNSGLCLDINSNTAQVPNGTGLQLFGCDIAAVWQLKDPFGNAGQLQHVASGKCVDLDSGSAADGARIQMWDCFTNNTNQIWTMPA